MTLVSGLFQINLLVDKLLIWYFLGPIELAIYVIVMTPVQMIQSFIPIDVISLPKLSGNKTISKENLIKKSWLILIGIIPIILVGYLISPTIFNLLFSDYKEYLIYFQVLLFILLFLPFSLFNTYLIAHARTKSLKKIRFLLLITKTTSLCILLPVFGLWGTIIAIFINQIISSSMTFIIFLKDENFK